MSCDERDRKIAVCEVLGLRCLHDRAGTFASLLYKDEMVSVRLSVRPSRSLLSHLNVLNTEICFCDC